MKKLGARNRTRLIVGAIATGIVLTLGAGVSFATGGAALPLIIGALFEVGAIAGVAIGNARDTARTRGPIPDATAAQIAQLQQELAAMDINTNPTEYRVKQKEIIALRLKKALGALKFLAAPIATIVPAGPIGAGIATGIWNFGKALLERIRRRGNAPPTPPPAP
jgi:hypothetical protein